MKPLVDLVGKLVTVDNLLAKCSAILENGWVGWVLFLSGLFGLSPVPCRQIPTWVWYCNWNHPRYNVNYLAAHHIRSMLWVWHTNLAVLSNTHRAVTLSWSSAQARRCKQRTKQCLHWRYLPWRMQMALAKVPFHQTRLASLVNLLYNMLDIRAVVGLKNYLQTWLSNILALSHDQAFLTAICTDLVHMHSQQLDCYHENFQWGTLPRLCWQISCYIIFPQSDTASNSGCTIRSSEQDKDHPQIVATGSVWVTLTHA